jgi:hypothetical protein
LGGVVNRLCFVSGLKHGQSPYVIYCFVR